MNPKNRWRHVGRAALILSLVSLAAGQQPAEDLEPFVDTLVVQGPEAAMQAALPTLLEPDAPAERVELAPTVVPAELIPQIARRRGDQNADGVIDERDLDAIKAARGACRDRLAGCAADLNLDGQVDDADLDLVRPHLGQDLRQSSSTFVERVGYSAAAPANVFPRLPAQKRLDGRRVAKVELRSVDAAGLRLQLAGLDGTDSLELRVYEPGGTVVLGPYINPRRGEDGTWWTPIIFGEVIGLEVALAPGREPPAAMPTIAGVMHLFCTDTQCHGAPGATMACHNDITCNQTWADNDGRAVGMIYFNSGGGCARCSGALLNRGPGDFSPLFMTANHCINTQGEADTVEVFWHYNTPNCNGAAPAYNTLLRSDGAILLKRHPGADWTLLGLLQAPQTNVYLGWDTNNWASGGGATGVHHPRGTFKRISTGSSAGSTDGALFCDPSGTVACTCAGGPSMCISVDVFNVSLTSGTTEPGSSGSPAFDASRRVRGTLTGGPSGCATVTAQYGRLDRAFTNLRYFLNDADIPFGSVFVNRVVGGDPGNAGSDERGTALNPFNAVAEATFCVRSGQEVRISPGGYNERFTIRRPMTLTLSSPGTVRIGSN